MSSARSRYRASFRAALRIYSHALIPVTGILIGGALTATVLGGRRALDELTMRHGEVEAGMALGESRAVERPLAGGANYAAVKAASEAWARAVGQGFAKAARDAGEPLAAASVVFRVKALSGLESTLSDAFVALWRSDAADVNGTVVTLGGGD